MHTRALVIAVSGAVLGAATQLGCGGSGDADAGRVTVQVVVGTAPPAVGGLPSVVLVEPQRAQRDPVPRDTVLMDQYASSFLPELLVARVDQPVEFRNSDDVPHMVRAHDVEGDSTLFNVATPIGESYTHVFPRGGFAISCDIHPSMTGFILVVTAPYHGIAADDGAFSVADVPPGVYTMRVWSRDSTRQTVQTIEVGEGRTVVNLEY